MRARAAATAPTAALQTAALQTAALQTAVRAVVQTVRPATGRTVLAIVAALAPVACSSASRYADAPGTALVVWETGREGDAMLAAARMEAVGWTADVAPAGPASRTRSSLALYGQRHRPGLGSALAEAVRPVAGEFDVLPFLADGPGRRDAVLWLAR